MYVFDYLFYYCDIDIYNYAALILKWVQIFCHFLSLPFFINLLTNLWYNYKKILFSYEGFIIL